MFFCRHCSNERLLVSSRLQLLLTAKCDNSHVFIGTLLSKMLNCFVKNAPKKKE